MTESQTTANNTRKQLRQAMRQRRRALSPRQQKQASQQLYRQLCTQPVFQRAKHIALYLANDGEIDPVEIGKQAEKQNKHCYLPVLAPDNHLWFKRYRRGDKLINNRFDIPEPQGNSIRRSSTLDLVLMPLVAFDPYGGRLGMGGGFYDRSFAWLKQRPKLRQPKLIGLAHHFQQVEQLDLAAWDIPLHGIATDKAFTLT